MNALARRICHAVEQRSDDVNVEMLARVADVLKAEVRLATENECTCGGAARNEIGCPACAVYHRLIN